MEHKKAYKKGESVLKVLCVIPARGGSKRVNKKNIRPLKGVPLIAYTLRDARESQNISVSVVSTDDPEIAAIAKKEGMRVVERPAEYAQDTSPIYYALRHAVRAVEETDRLMPDIVVWLQPNVPFREKGLIDGVVMQLVSNYSRTDSVATVYEVDYHPEEMKVIRDGFLEFLKKPKRAIYLTQELPKYYKLDGSVIAMKAKVLMDEGIPESNGHFYMGCTMPFIHSFPYTVEVDEETDFFLLEYILERKLARPYEYNN
jgi:N-acylneuraminate cytidylyltransferase/CMP-N,N'-diacetyllegionaminic acid synthase